MADMGSATLALMEEKTVRGVGTRGDPGARTFLVAVDDDGTSRRGFAEYVCHILVKHGVHKNTLVKIIDFKAAQNGEEIELGAVVCPDLSQAQKLSNATWELMDEKAIRHLEAGGDPGAWTLSDS